MSLVFVFIFLIFPPSSGLRSGALEEEPEAGVRVCVIIEGMFSGGGSRGGRGAGLESEGANQGVVSAGIALPGSPGAHEEA